MARETEAVNYIDPRPSVKAKSKPKADPQVQKVSDQANAVAEYYSQGRKDTLAGKPQDLSQMPPPAELHEAYLRGVRDAVRDIEVSEPPSLFNQQRILEQAGPYPEFEMTIGRGGAGRQVQRPPAPRIPRPAMTMREDEAQIQGRVPSPAERMPMPTPAMTMREDEAQIQRGNPEMENRILKHLFDMGKITEEDFERARRRM